MVHDWVFKGLVCATGHIKDPCHLSNKSRALCPGGRFPPSFIQVIIITVLNKCMTVGLCSRPEDGLRCRQGVKPPLKLKILMDLCAILETLRRCVFEREAVNPKVRFAVDSCRVIGETLTEGSDAEVIAKPLIAPASVVLYQREKPYTPVRP